MLSKYNNVFILGAGANQPYGFPLGLELYENICKEFINNLNHCWDNFGLPLNYQRRTMFEIKANAYNNAINKAYAISIDKYLNINKEFMDVGKISIVSEIFKSENKAFVPSVYNKAGGDWFTYMFQKMILGIDDIEAIKQIHDKNSISFITFNYDRLIEHLLFEKINSLISSEAVSFIEMVNMIKKFPIIHVFGKIGYLPWEKEIDNNEYYDECENVISFSDRNDLNPILVGINSKEMINLMYEDRANSPEIKEAKDLIANADRIFFLGFGFDSLNLNILNLPSLIQNKEIFATAYKQTPNEIRQIKKSLNLKSDAKMFLPCDCLQLLRDFLE